MGHCCQVLQCLRNLRPLEISYLPKVNYLFSYFKRKIVLNAERAATTAPAFASKITRTRRALMEEIAKKFIK